MSIARRPQVASRGSRELLATATDAGATDAGATDAIATGCNGTGSIPASLAETAYPPLRSVTPAATVPAVVDVDRLRAAYLGVPRATRLLALRVVCLQVPEWASTARGRVIESVCLGVGEPGRDPELVFPGGQQVAIINTHLALTPSLDGTLHIDGPYLAARRNRPAVSLRWGVRTVGGHFLLFGGTHLGLPRLVTDARRSGHCGAPPVLTVTVSLTDGCGGPLLGVVDADDLAWRLTSGREQARIPHRGIVPAEGA